MIHELKILPEFFEAVVAGKKTFEIRSDDRPYHEGDVLALNEFRKETETYTGRSCLVYIDYILDDERFAPNGVIVMAIKPCRVEKCSLGIYNPMFMSLEQKIPLVTDEKEEADE